MSREILHRVVVDVDHDVAGLEASLDAHQMLRPSGYGTRLAPFGFTFRREPAVFHFVATGTSLGAGIMLAEFSTRIRAFGPLALGFSGMFFLLAIYNLMTVLRNAATRLDILADGEMVTIHRRGLLRTLTDRLAADQIVGVLVAKDEHGNRSVVIAGPRHTALLDVHRAKLLDPDTLPAWIADGIGLVARRATVRAAASGATSRDERAESTLRSKLRRHPRRRSRSPSSKMVQYLDNRRGTSCRGAASRSSSGSSRPCRRAHTHPCPRRSSARRPSKARRGSLRGSDSRTRLASRRIFRRNRPPHPPRWAGNRCRAWRRRSWRSASRRARRTDRGRHGSPSKR